IGVMDDDTGLLQDSEMLGCGRRGDRQQIGQLAEVAGADAKQVADNKYPDRMSERLGQLGQFLVLRTSLLSQIDWRHTGSAAAGVLSFRPSGSGLGGCGHGSLHSSFDE